MLSLPWWAHGRHAILLLHSVGTPMRAGIAVDRNEIAEVAQQYVVKPEQSLPVVPKREKRCAQCGKPFVPMYGNQRYHSNECRLLAEQHRYNRALENRKKRRRRLTEAQRLCSIARRLLRRTGGAEVQSATVCEHDIRVIMERVECPGEPSAG